MKIHLTYMPKSRIREGHKGFYDMLTIGTGRLWVRKENCRVYNKIEGKFVLSPTYPGSQREPSDKISRLSLSA